MPNKQKYSPYSLHAQRVSVIITIGVLALQAYCANLRGVEVPANRIILFIFLGHSNMQGYGGKPDLEPHPRAWMYNLEKGFYPAVDPIETSYRSPSPVLPFLKSMALQYSDYYFAGIKISHAGRDMAATFLPGTQEYEKLRKTIDSVRTHVTIGGVLCMFGWCEGINDSLSQRFLQDAKTLIQSLRTDIGSPDLPILWGRYEENANRNKFMPYYAYSSRIRESIDSLPGQDTLHRTALCPSQFIAKQMYFDDHHYNERGYALWAQSAVVTYVENQWDFWYSAEPDTIAPTSPDSIFVDCKDATHLLLTWHRAYDNVFVREYRIYRFGVKMATVPATDTTYVIRQPSTDPVVSYTIRAVDKAEKESPVNSRLFIKNYRGAKCATQAFVAHDTGSLSIINTKKQLRCMRGKPIRLDWLYTLDPRMPLFIRVSKDGGRHYSLVHKKRILAGDAKVTFLSDIADGELVESLVIRISTFSGRKVAQCRLFVDK